MSEIQTPDEDKRFSGRSVAIAAGLLGVGAVVGAIGSADQRSDVNSQAAEISNESVNEKVAYGALIKGSVEASYDASALIDNVSVKENDTLGALGEGVVISDLGDEEFNDIESRIHGPLFDSGALHNPQPGDKYSVVKVDLDPEKNNGDEYVIVDPTHVIHPAVEIPTPTVEDGSNESQTSGSVQVGVEIAPLEEKQD